MENGNFEIGNFEMEIKIEKKRKMEIKHLENWHCKIVKLKMEKLQMENGN